MRREIVTSTAQVTNPEDEAEIYLLNKNKFLEEARSHFGVGKRNVYFYSSFEGITQVAVEFANEQSLPVVRLTYIVAAARTCCDEADQFNSSVLEELLSRYRGNSLVIKDNDLTSPRKDYIDVVGAAINHTFEHYKKRGGQVLIFSPKEPTGLLELTLNRPRDMILVQFCPYRTSE